MKVYSGFLYHKSYIIVEHLQYMNKKIIYRYISNAESNYLALATVVMAFITVMLIATQQAHAQVSATPNNQSINQAAKTLVDRQLAAYNAGKAAANNGQPDTCPSDIQDPDLCNSFEQGWHAVKGYG
jgi:hypothetical protein